MRSCVVMPCVVGLVVLAGVVRGATPAELASLRAAIVDLSATFGADYPQGQAYLARLAEIEKKERGEWEA